MSQFIIRRATRADTEALVAFNADVSRYQDAAEPDAGIAAWTRDLMEGRHPCVDAGDFTVVEQARTGSIVSALGVISQTWSYGGIEFGVGQPELVGTHPDYRGHGLVRRQFDTLHRRSAERGEKLLAIDGIPWFYRQFGYEMALALRGEYSIATERVTALARSRAEPYRVRPASDSDLSFIAQTYEHATARYLVAACRNETLWRHELHGRSDTNPWRLALRVVETAGGRRVAFLAHQARLSGSTLTLAVYEAAAGISWHDITPSVLRYLRATGETYAARAPQARCERIGLCLGTDHPAYGVISDLAPRDDGAYAWYLRVADVPDFLRHVSPVLRRRLGASALAEYTGDLLISFYRDGVRLRFAAGELTEVTQWQQSLQLAGIEKGEPTTAPRAAAYFPGLTFLQLLFGHRSLDELQYAFADCLVRTEEARGVLRALFPKQPSNVWPVL